MARNVAVQTWQPCDSKGGVVASIPLVFATDPTWNVNIRNTSFRDVSVNVAYVMVDNYANGLTQTVNMGPFTYTVPAYNRAVYKIPPSSTTVIVSLSADCNIILANEEAFPYLASAADEIAIQQASQAFVSYTWLGVAAGRNQALTDQNRNLLLSNAGAQNYSLLSIAGSSIPNGYYNPLIRNGGAGRWSIVPNGANQINSIWTAANPLRLTQDDQVEFWCDGSQWLARGIISNSALSQSAALGATLTFAHGLVKEPEIARVFLRCTTAEFNYSIGDRVFLTETGGYDGASQNNVTVLKDATNVVVIKPAAGSGYRIRDKNLRTTAVITVANWTIDIEAVATV
jgi:hypothetical protein